jgi:hypothetical protein
MRDEEPDQAAEQHREVQDRVIEVEDLQQQRVRQEDGLQAGLIGQLPGAFQVPDPACPAQRVVAPEQRERPRDLPEREQPAQQRRLPGKAGRETETMSTSLGAGIAGDLGAALPQDDSRHGQTAGQDGALLPGHPDIDHR